MRKPLAQRSNDRDHIEQLSYHDETRTMQSAMAKRSRITTPPPSANTTIPQIADATIAL